MEWSILISTLTPIPILFLFGLSWIIIEKPDIVPKDGGNLSGIGLANPSRIISSELNFRNACFLNRNARCGIEIQ